MIRKIFKDTALWQPAALTDDRGRATIKVQLPDNLTTWRATARALTTDLRVGASVNKTLARKDVIVRLAMPRFLTEGDTVTISGIVHNYLKQAKQTKITLEANGAELHGQAAEQVLTLEPNGEHRLNFQLTAPRTGNITLLAKALTDTESDAVELPLEVAPRGIERARGSAVSMFDEQATREVTLELPANANTDSARLFVEAAPSIATNLFGALDYLTTYPYGCTEQTLSSFVPNVVVARTLQNVENSFVKDTARLNQNVARGLKRIYAYQNGDGGWSWFDSERSNPFMTAYAIDALTMAREAGYDIEDAHLSQAGSALMKMLNDNQAADGKTLDVETRAYATFALAKINRTSGFVNELYNRRGELQPYGRALLTLALIEIGDEPRARETLLELERTARVNDYEAHWEATRNTSGEHIEINNVETTALAIKALARLNPQSTLLAKAAVWLVNNRAHGSYWLTTKQTAFAIYALVDYLKISNEETPDYQLEIYLDDKQVFAAHITPEDVRSGKTLKLERRGAEVKSVSRLRIVKRGTGALYFNTRLKFFTSEENTEAASTTDLNLAREYLRLKIADKDGTSVWVTEPLRGDVRSGDLIVSRLRVRGARGRYLLIEDPIPAGCEQITQSSGLSFDRDEKTWTDYYSAREFRDNRTAFFLDYFDGDATFNYVLRVQTPGAFRIAAARAELMYQPTVNANTATSSLTINDR